MSDSTETSGLRPIFRRSAWMIGLGILALVGAAWFVWHRIAAGSASAATQRGRPTATVASATAERADIPILLNALGTITPLASAVVRAQVSGVLMAVPYREGQMVERGQVLAVIDPRPFQYTLGQAIGALARDEAQLEVGRTTLARDRTLLAQDSIAQLDVDTQEATVKQLEGTVQMDRANVATAKLNLGYTRIVAPISGRVGLRAVDVGNYVTPGDAAGIATITQLRPIDVVFSLPSDTIQRVEKRSATAAQLPVQVLDRGRATILATGTFLTLDNEVDVQTDTVRAKARFANTDGALFPNQFVNVQVLLDTVHAAVVIPIAAVHHGPDGDFVYVITAENTARLRKVTLGPSTADRISIASGLEAGEPVVTEGGDRLTDSASIKLPGKGFAPRSTSDAPDAARKRHKEQKPVGTPGP